MNHTIITGGRMAGRTKKMNDLKYKYETVLAALKFGFYFIKDGNIKKTSGQVRTLQYSNDFKTITIASQYEIETPVILYGNTWALTREELEK